MSEQDQPQLDAAMSRRKLLKGAAVAGAGAAVFAEPVLRAAPAYGHTGGLSGAHDHRLIAWSSNMDSWILGGEMMGMQGITVGPTTYEPADGHTNNGGDAGQASPIPTGSWDFNVTTGGMATLSASGNADFPVGVGVGMVTVDSAGCRISNVSVVGDMLGAAPVGTVTLMNVTDMGFDFTVTDASGNADGPAQGMINFLFDIQC